MDYSKLSDQDLLALKAGDYTKLSNETLLALKNESHAAPTAEGPGTLKSAALGAMSGIPGAETVVSGIEALSPNTTYAQAHQGLEEGKDAAWQSHPVAYGAGKVAGMAGTGLALPATASLGGAAAMGAGLGALSGVDTASNTTEAIKGGLEGVGTGAVLGSVGHGIGKAIEAIPGVSKSILGSLGSQTSKSDIESYLANPETINSALSKEGIANKVAGLTGDITKASSQLSENARGMLNSTDNPLNIKNIKDITMEAAQKYFTEGNPATAADETAIKAIVDQYQKLAQIADVNNGQVPETVLRRMIDRIQSSTKDSTYGNPEAGASQQALKEMGGRLNDLLRKANPTYAEAMAPSAEAADLSSKLQDTFKIEGNQPTDATAGKIGNLLKEGKPETQDLADQLKNMTGTDIKSLMVNAQTKENLNAPGAGGALKTLMAGLGFSAGKMTGVPFGGIGGAAIGRYSAESMNGGSIAKSIMDTYLKGQNSWPGTIAKSMAKYGPVLINAAKVGGNQLAATHFVLATSNPEYQSLIDHAQKNIPDTQANTGIVNQE